jgi:high-affinity nickel-transport protein
VGLLFALGHSGAVGITSLAVSVTASAMSDGFTVVRQWGAIGATLTSAIVLMLVAPRNALAAWHIYRGHSGLKGRGPDGSPEPLRGGLLTRLMRPMFQLKLQGWQLMLMGALFGLGFETASALAVIGMSAAGAAGGATWGMAMMFPLAFMAGMTLVDAVDGLFMERAYGWATLDPRRRATYNLVVTLVSSLLAIFVGAFEILTLLNLQHARGSVIGDVVSYVEDHYESFGFLVMIVFGVGWVGYALVTRARRGIDITAGEAP